MTTKRRKKYNPVKNARNNNVSILNSYAVAFVVNDFGARPPIRMTNLKGEEIIVKKNMRDAVTLYKYKWSVCLVVFMIIDGEPAISYELVASKEPYLQSELVDVLNDNHKRIISEHDDGELIGGGWIASATTREFSEKEIFSILERLGAFNVREAA